jgi:PKD repeat protein
MKLIPLVFLGLGLAMLLTACSMNNPHTIATFRGTPSRGPAPLEVSFSWRVSEPDGDALTCKLDANGDGTFDFTIPGCTSLITRQYTYASTGTYTARLRIEDSKGGSASKTTSITVSTPSSDPYDITLRFTGSPTPSQQAAFDAAAARWQQVITQGFPTISLNFAANEAANECASSFPAFNGSVDDILIDAAVVNIDGPGGILGQAGPCRVRGDNNLTSYGVMQFDSADIAWLEASGQLDEVIFHEMGHVLGIGTLWDYKRSLLRDAGTKYPRFVGAGAVHEWLMLGGSGDVPVENCRDRNDNPIPGCGSGIRDGHWREAVFDNEIMTGFLNSGANPLSRLTIASLEDLGYSVNYGAAEPYTLPGLQASSRAAKIPLNIILIKPKGSR